ncbi:unnamed protein product [Haemonchus placei]|uniref:Uncharacterized protein n=1 Tax=Haemonchus placei TaxID=6290 RepID=A0A0N4WBR0_HAEPC|nr:unnamed protein product [Haemonchus placei]
MVRLVFRPYTQVYRSICTSEPIRTSTRVSSDFVLLRHSSPSFGSQPVRSTAAHLHADKTGPWCAASKSRSHVSRLTDLYFHYALGFCHLSTRIQVTLLGPYFTTGRKGDQVSPYTHRTHSQCCQRNHRQHTSPVATIKRH